MPLTYRYYEGRNISNSGTAQTIAKPERLKPRPIGKCIFNSGNDYVKFSISLHKHSSPGTVRLTIYKRRHISASGTTQTVAKPARLKPMGKFLRGTGSRNMASFIVSQMHYAWR